MLFQLNGYLHLFLDTYWVVSWHLQQILVVMTA
jgi:hypothetical protein